MPNKTWKQVERNVAKKIGGVRNSLSGKNSKITSGDVIHDIFYIEVKHRKKIPFYAEFKKTMKKAKNEGKIPMVVIHEKFSRNYIVMIDINNLGTLLNEYDKIIIGK